WNPQSVAKSPDIRNVPPNIQPLFAANSLIAAFDLGKEYKLELRFEFPDADKAGAGEKALQATIEMARAGLLFPINMVEQELRKDPDNVGLDDLPERFGMLFALGFLRDLDDLLKNAKLETKGSTVRIPFQYNKVASAQQTSLLMLLGVSMIGRSASATFNRVGMRLEGPGEKGNPNEQHLRKVAEAMEKYHVDKGHYPPPAILDKDGRPILSWRVALLPYIGEQEIYTQFHLDEPWDSLHNKKLLKKMPEWLRRSDNFDYFGPGHMMCLDFLNTGAGSPFASRTGVKRGDVDNKAILVMFTESSDPAVYWSKPIDLGHEAGKPLTRLFGKYPQPVHVLLKDGTYKSFNRDSEKELRALLEPKKN
ncbi:MAG: DUF1559 domain-containing protein, partial [Gemmataceae bacterium]